ncbi:MAG: HlyD family secretion protein, partial [Methyloligellaceae bacterium]
ADAGVKQSWEQLRRATAEVTQKQSELAYANQELNRALRLRAQGHVSVERVEQRQTQKDSASAALRSAEARIAEARATIEAAVARVERLKADLREYELKAPRAGRVQYRLAEPGEVLAAGGKVLALLDLTDVHMTIFLPTKEAGRLALGSEARIVLDAASDYVIPAKVSFVAAEAQFTPKYVETASEREKLMFRVKVQVPRDVLEKYAPLVKTGIPGVAYVKTASSARWPEHLGVKLP